MVLFCFALNPALFILQIYLNWISIFNICSWLVEAFWCNQYNARPPTQAFHSYLEVSVAKSPRTWKDYLAREFWYCNESCCFPNAEQFTTHTIQSAQCSPTHPSIPLLSGGFSCRKILKPNKNILNHNRTSLSGFLLTWEVSAAK